MNIALIIGNGFDLSLGLPTSFSHFLESECFNSLLPHSHLCQHLHRIYDENFGWVDIEYELAEYSMTNSKDTNLKTEYLELCQALADYLGDIELNYDKIDTESQAYLSFGDYFFNAAGHKSTEKLIVVNFNYTYSIKKLKQNLYGNGFFGKAMTFVEAFSPLLGDDNPFSNIKFLHPHGAVDTGIVFGVDDSAIISPKHTFLRKSSWAAYKPFNPKILQQADKVIIWGHSLGESDHGYFMDFFEKQASGRCDRKEIVITYYGENGYDSIITQLDILTQHNIRGLKLHNRLKLIDSSSDECRWKL